MKAAEHSASCSASALGERVTTGVIAGNGLIVIAVLLDPQLERLLGLIENAFLVFFLLELVLRMRQAGWDGFRDGWLMFDLVLVAVAVLPVGSGVLALRLARLARTARIVHLLRHSAIHFSPRRVMSRSAGRHRRVRTEKLTHEQRSEVAKKGAADRWRSEPRPASP
jgi:hypothetical protein